MSLIILPLLFVVMYFLMIRPQQRKLREHQDLINALDVGDDVVTSSGIYGRVSDLDGDTIFLQVSDSVELKVTKESVAGLVSYGDVDEDELVDDE